MDFTDSYSGENLIRFLIPLMAAELFQQLYALINTFVVSRVLDYRAVAVIGACSGLLAIRGNLLSGMIFGFGIYLGKAAGSRDPLRFRQAFSGAFWYAAGMGLLGAAVLPLIGPMLQAAKIPAKLHTDAFGYLAVSFGGSFCVALKLLLLVTLQAVGETGFFSVLAAAGVAINTVLVVLLIGVFHGSVAYSAFATILTNLLLAVCLFWHIRKKHRDLLTLVSPWVVSGGIWTDLVKNGMAKSAYFMLGSMGRLVLQGAINSFSIEMIAGQSWAISLQTILFSLLGELGTASGVITGQNAGAGNLNNVRVYHRKLCTAMMMIGAVEILFIYLAGLPLLRLLCSTGKPVSGNPGAVVQAADQWIRVTVLAMPFCFAILYRNALQALGRYHHVVALGAVEFAGVCLTAVLLVPVYGYRAAALGTALNWLVQAMIGCRWFRRCLKGEM